MKKYYLIRFRGIMENGKWFIISKSNNFDYIYKKLIDNIRITGDSYNIKLIDTNENLNFLIETNLIQ